MDEVARSRRRTEPAAGDSRHFVERRDQPVDVAADFRALAKRQ